MYEQVIYQILNKHKAVVAKRDDFDSAVRWAQDYLSGDWSVRTVEGGCVVGMVFADELELQGA